MRLISIKSLIITMGLSSLSGMIYAQEAYNDKPFTKQAMSNLSPTLADPWNGIYAGFILGGVFNDVNLRANQLGFANPEGQCNSNADFSSVYPGVQLGVSRQFGSRLVLGIMGDYSYNATRQTDVACPCPGDLAVSDRFSIQNKMQGSLLGRIGYALNNNLLPYLAGGISFADLGMNYSNESNDFYSNNTTQAGWRIGGGLEWGFAPAWSVSAEYHYTGYNSMNLDIPRVFGLLDPNGNANFNLATNNIQVSLNYWLN